MRFAGLTFCSHAVYRWVSTHIRKSICTSGKQSLVWRQQEGPVLKQNYNSAKVLVNAIWGHVGWNFSQKGSNFFEGSKSGQAFKLFDILLSSLFEVAERDCAKAHSQYVYWLLIKQATMEGLAPEGMWIGRSISLCHALPGCSRLAGKECPSRPVSRAISPRVHSPGPRGRAGHRPSSETLCVTLTVAITGQCS